MSKRKTKILEYNVIFTAESEGGYSAYAPDLPGCNSQGETFEEAKINIKEAIELYLETVDDDLYEMTPEQSRKQFTAPIQVNA
ncbi:MAG: hypothetical protein ACD_30C00077G0001 [uncultured bacterium]|uniref:HicB-like antitoxin of toxin-antitoxin system domain-containing protein n=3 Tax=Candidatus Daviesiibacteriota TaxID=1752718 RepID=A0A0G0F5T9_9BACT|nr:MAG: hypothetical protein ACD_30C00077G0001 [uncultured bacterium]KKQ08885.1 MAG: hypothetical protein US19_C0018G0002 [Candidatus Daviesbacteria bacterium GW2011_GWB1_36_5]KKQ13875.1 MAG: hypothetical protein US28_C0043G0006 [Candidatus Daviesbacteria bacterium GW2011_GWA1_36_8]OGE33609.1 MAG: hypothetical protein A3C99_03320 [Candidatus Daviesbacteria bacterium RIFCSPHIGHO2_02_FULL_37_9]OGE34333.1 MAG: hypothetical protein A3E66_04925 [Candidatus Daviesbacteria bacterium RIFCSPHIGHO2_12_FU